jgi:hypothetical protein
MLHGILISKMFQEEKSIIEESTFLPLKKGAVVMKN